MRSCEYRTNLETRVTEALKKLKADFREQVPTRSGFVLDYVVQTPQGEIILEADGPTHQTPEGKKKDRFRDRVLKREGWGHIYHLDQDLILQPNRLCERLSEILTSHSGAV